MKELDQNWEAVYPHPPERVWRALTSPKELAKWLLPGSDFIARPGHRFQWQQDTQSIHGEVLTAEAPHRLSYTWQRIGSEEPLTVVTWTLERIENGTRLRLTHVSAEAYYVQGNAATFRTHRLWRKAI